MAQTLDYAELEGLWIAAGGPINAAPVAAAITFPESGADPTSVQQGQPYELTGWGLWQITPGNSFPSIGTDQQLLNPLTNARAAVQKYKDAGNSFHPWTTYNNGAYLAHLKTGVTPADSASLGGFSIGSIPGNPLNPLFGSGGNPLSGIGASVHLLGRLVDPAFWKRVGKMAIAILLGILAASFLFGNTSAGQTVKSEGKSAGQSAAAAAVLV